MRRIRLLLVAAAVVLGVLAVAWPASAQEGDSSSGGSSSAVEEVKHEAEANGASHADAECIELLAEGKAVEDCQKAPNPLLPEKNELIWGAFGFVVVFLFLWKVGYPAIKQGMDARADRIRSDLEAAESTKTEAEQVLSEYRAQLNDAKAESGRIIEEARATADQMRRDLQARAETEIGALRAKAQSDIEAAKVQAISDLRGEVASLAIGAAEKVVGRNLDRDTNSQLVEQFIAEVGANK